MAHVSRKDYDTLQRGLRTLYAHHDLDTLPRAAVVLINALVPNNLCAYNEVDPYRRRANVVFEPEENMAEMFARIQIWEKYMHQHPLVVHFHQNPADGPRKVSDFLTDAQFRRLKLYTDCYHHIKCRYQMVVSMPSPAPLTVAVAMNRWERDFTERDRAILALLQPHLRQAYDNAALITDLSNELARAQEVLDRIDYGIAVIDGSGNVHRASPAAVRFSVEHFAGDPHASLSRHMPDVLRQWATVQIAALERAGDDAARPEPLILEGPAGRLLVRVVTDRQPGRFLLIMHNARMPNSAEPLEGLGLTPREAEVLLAMVHGQSAQDVADAMDISERTVEKHMENMFRKLGVPNRTAAVTRALQWLRL